MGLAETIVLALETVVQAFNFFILVYVFFNRNYAPIKIKQVPLIIGAGIGNILKPETLSLFFDPCFCFCGFLGVIPCSSL